MNNRNVDSLILRQLIRETLLNEYKYSWDTARIEAGAARRTTGSTSKSPLPGAAGPGLFSKLSDTFFGKKASKSKGASATGFLSRTPAWLQKFLVGKLGKRVAGTVIGGGMAGFAISAILDYVMPDGATDIDKEDVQQEITSTIESNSATIGQEVFIGVLQSFSNTLGSRDFNNVQPTDLKRELDELHTKMGLGTRIKNLSSFLSRDDPANASGIADSSISLKSGNFRDADIAKKSKTMITSAATADMYGSLLKEVGNTLTALKEKIDDVKDPTAKTEFEKVFAEFEKTVTDDFINNSSDALQALVESP